MLCAPPSVDHVVVCRALKCAVFVLQDGGHHIVSVRLTNGMQLHFAFDRYSLFGKGIAQDGLRFCLGDEEHVIVFAVDAAEFEAKDPLPCVIDTACNTAVPADNHWVHDATLLEKLQRPCLDSD